MVRKLVLLAALLSILGCTQHRIVQQEFDSARIHPLREFKMFRSVSDITTNIAYLEEGETFPLKLSLDSEWLGIEQKEINLVAKRRIFLRISLPDDFSQERLDKLVSLGQENLTAMDEAERTALFKGVMIHLSKDAVHWAPLNDTQALKEVFGIQAGSLSAGMGLNADEGLWTALSLTTFAK